MNHKYKGLFKPAYVINCCNH